MWLNNLRITDKKSMSSSEILVLANTVSDDFLEGQEILNNINNQIPLWGPTAGTIYPILHRLVDLQLLDRHPQDKMLFKISDKGSMFLVSTIRAFQDNYESTSAFFASILNGFIKVDPIQSIELLQKFQEKAKLFTKKMNTLELQAKQNADENNWTDVSVTH